MTSFVPKSQSAEIKPQFSCVLFQQVLASLSSRHPAQITFLGRRMTAVGHQCKLLLVKGLGWEDGSAREDAL